MNGLIVAGCLWVVLSAIVALLPMRLQYAPGIVLLLAAPVLIVWMGIELGWIAAAIALAAFVSMFRNPLIYLYKKARGLPVSRPEERP
jgi:hypothetical protein